MAEEQKFQTKVLRWLRMVPNTKWIKYPGGVYGEKGTPDLIGTYEGRMILIEVKGPKTRITSLQEVRLAEWNRAGARALVLRSPMSREAVWDAVGLPHPL